MKIDGPRMAFLECLYSVNGTDGLAGLSFKDGVSLPGRADIYVKLWVSP